MAAGISDIPFTEIGQNANDLPSAPAEMFVKQKDDATVRARRVKRTVEGAESDFRKWESKAKEWQRFYDGHQWEDYDKMVMEQSKRPTLVYNEVKKVVRAICGLERLNRTDVRFVTRPLDSTLEDDLVGDLATAASAAVDDVSDSPFERSLSVKDLTIRGMGWMETRMDFQEDLDGQIVKERVDSFEMRWDPHARKSGLVDSRWRARKRNMPRELFKERWPDKADLVEQAETSTDYQTINKYELVTPHYSLANQRANPQVGESGGTKGTVPVIQFQERIQVPVYRIANPDKPDELIEFSEDSWKELKAEFRADNLPLPDCVRQTKTLHRQMYYAQGVELEDPVDLPGNRFSLQCMTGEWDDEKKIWVGIVGEMMDPQKTKNKSLSTGLNFYLTNAKGGLLHETGAFVNERTAKADWSSPNPWIQLQEGGLKKIQPRTPTTMPPELAAFFEIGTRAITETIGVSQELLGLGQNEMSNPTQKGRLAAGLAIFGWLFDEINRFKKDEANLTLDFIREFMTDGRMITIGGPTTSQAIPLLKENLPEKNKYSLQVDESIKHNPNLKAQLWTDILPIIPAIIRFGGVQALLFLMKFSPYPAQVVSQIQKFAMQNQQGQQQKGRKDSPEMEKAKIGKIGADAQRALAQARTIDATGVTKVAELLLEGIKLDADIKRSNRDHSHKKVVDTMQILQSLIPQS